MYNPIKVQQVNPQAIKSLAIGSFRGVDFREGNFRTDNTRAKDAKNVIWGDRLELTSRTGIKNVLDSVLIENGNPQKIHGIFVYEPLNEVFIHAGTKIYKLTKTTEIAFEEAFLGGQCTYTVAYSNINESPSSSFMFEGKMYIVGCGKYLVYDGVTIHAVEDAEGTFIPTTVIGRAPSGGGTAFEPVNLLNKWRKNSFYSKRKPTPKYKTYTGDGSRVEFPIYPGNSTFTNDAWIVLVDGISVDFTSDRINNKVILTEAPAIGARVYIEYYVTPNKERVVDTFTGDGETKSFALSTVVPERISSDEWIVTVNGVRATVDEDRVGCTVRFHYAPAVGDVITVEYYLNPEVTYENEFLLDSDMIDDDGVIVTVNNVEITEDKRTDSYSFPYQKLYSLLGITPVYSALLYPKPDGTITEFSLGSIVLASGYKSEDYYQYKRFLRSDSLVEVRLHGQTVTGASLDVTNGKITFTSAPMASSELLYAVLRLAIFDVDRENGKIRFLEGVPSIYEDGIDNIVIKFAKTVYEQDIERYSMRGFFPIPGDPKKIYINTSTGKKYRWNGTQYEETQVAITKRSEQINKCSIYGMFGGENDTRVFLTGNPDTPNKDWTSGLYDPTYFPDTGYGYVGADNVKIMGYVRLYNMQIIIKEPSIEDATAYVRTFTLDDQNNPVFPLKQGLTETGAISPRSFAYLDGKPLFASARGIETLYGTNVDERTEISNVSEMIKTALDDSCIGITTGTRYILFTKDAVFVCDSRLQFRGDMGHRQYEWLIWKDLPQVYSAQKLTIDNQEYLLIGADGMLYRFKLPNEEKAYIDEVIVDGELKENAIECYWKTFDFIFGDLSKRKRVRNLHLMLNPDDLTSVRIKARIDSSRDTTIGTVPASYPYIKPLRLMIERIHSISFTFENVGDHLSLSGAQVEYQHMNS